MTTKEHFSITFNLAYPVMLSQLGQVLVGVADSMMVGQLGAVPLAASSLANSIFFVVLMFGMGVSMGITPLVSKADGRGKKKRISKLFQHGLWLNIATSVALTILLIGFGEILYFLDQPDQVVDQAIPYLWVITASLFPFMIFQTFKQFAEGLAHTRQAMFITIFCNVINIILNWILIFGKLGFPELGLMGAGYATLISRILMPIMMGWYVLNSRRYQMFDLSLRLKSFSRLLFGRIMNIGLPTGFQYIFEVSAFSAAAIMMGWIGVNALAAHQIALNLAAISYMMASGLSTAGMIRVGNQIGRGDMKTMREAGMMVFKMVLVFMSMSAIIFVLGRFFLPSLYIDDAEVISLAGTLLVIAGLFQLSDGAQVVGLGVLRGMEDVRVPTIVTLLAYWVFGLPLAYLLAFPLGLNEVGIWYGLLIGLSVTAVLLFVRFKRLSNKLIAGEEISAASQSLK